MNKIISINIGGFVFQIEDEAYERLEQYLTSIKKRFGNTEGSDEIVADIEARIAEMLKEKIDAGALSVTLAHIEEVISIMGNPSEIGGEEGAEDADEDTYTDYNYRTGKKLYRDTDDKVVSGVCSGLGLYFGLEPVWIRAAFAISFFVFGTGALLYFILWGIIPEAKTSADKLRMRGEKINIDNLEKRIREEMEKVEAAFTGKSGKKKRNETADKIKSGFRDILETGLRIFGKIIGAAFVIFGLTFLAFLVIGSLRLFDDVHFPVFRILPLLYENNWEYVLSLSALITVILIPLIMMTVRGVMLIVGVSKIAIEVKRTVWSLWSLGLIIGIVMLVLTLINFTDKASVYETTEIPTTDTLYVDGLIEKSYSQYDYRINRLVSIDGILKNANVRFTIEPSNTGKVELETIKSARGSSYRVATMNAENINDSFTIIGNKLSINNTFSTNPEKLYREQEIIYVLHIPVGTTVIIGNNMKRLLYDVDNVHHMLDRNMVGKTWIMTKEGLTCVTCTESVIDTHIEGKEYVKAFDVEYFTRIDIEDVFKVTIKYGDNYSLQLAGKHDWVERAEVDKSGDMLKLSMDHTLFENQTEDEVVEVYITLPRLDYLAISGVAEVALDGFNQHYMKLEVDGAGSLLASINIESLELHLNGASKADIRGEGQRLELDMNGAGTAKCTAYKVDAVNVDIDGACTAEVFARNIITGDIDGAAALRYKGTPNLRVDNNLAGNTKKID